MGVRCGWEAKGGLYHPLEQEQGRYVFNEAQKQPQFSYMSGQDSRWQQFDTTCSLISVPQWHHICHSGPSEFIGSEKMLPVKADLAICRPVIDVSG